MNSCTESICRNCKQTGAELRITPCNCCFHTKCFPLSHLTEGAKNNSQGLHCPSCHSSEMKAVCLLPLDIQEVKNCYVGRTSMETNTQDAELTPELEDFYLTLAPIFLFETEGNGCSNIEIAEDVEIRNGRWTSEEVKFIESLIEAFKDGNLVVGNGITLNNFLRSLFLCKSTRLRKKIKNANFCTSTYVLKENPEQTSLGASLSQQQESFLNSLDNDKKRKLLKFSMGRMWATYFFNLCIELGYESIVAQDWLDSCAAIEDKVQKANESKKQRDRRSRVAEISTPTGAGRPRELSIDISTLGSLNDDDTLEFDADDDVGMNTFSSRPPVQTMDASNHSYGFSGLNLDSSYHSHRYLPKIPPPPMKTGEQFAHATKPVSHTSYKRQKSLSMPKMHFHSFNHAETKKVHPSQGQPSPSLQNTAETTHSGSLANTFHSERAATSSAPLSPNNRNAMMKGIPRPPLLIPTEIEQNVKKSPVHYSDVSSDGDSKSLNSFSQSPGILPDLSVDVKTEKNNGKRPRTNSLEDALSTIDFDACPPIQEVDTESLLDISDVCDKFGDWNPFVKKIANVIEIENLPFEYFDVWVASKDDNSSSLVLRHVGHSARATGSIWTLYHMNQFGKLSSKFRFLPGQGLPGRVYESGEPLWDDSIQDLSSNDFPRYEGAKLHGIKKALGIPIFNTPLGKIVVALYTSNDIAQDDAIVSRCCELFQSSNVFDPKWQIVLDVGTQDSTEKTDTGEYVSNGIDIKAIDQVEQQIANFLAKYAPIPTDDSIADNQTYLHTSLRLLLLRPLSRRTPAQKSSIDIIKASYKNYLRANRNESDIAALLIREWSFLQQPPQSEQSGVSTPGKHPALETSSKDVLPSSNNLSQSFQQSVTSSSFPRNFSLPEFPAQTTSSGYTEPPKFIGEFPDPAPISSSVTHRNYSPIMKPSSMT